LWEEEEAGERLSSMRTPLVETPKRTLLMEIYLEELDLAIPTGCGECWPIWREGSIHNISTNILDLEQAKLYIPRSQGARSILLHHQVKTPHLCMWPVGQDQKLGGACVRLLLLLYHRFW
jgi:hypothetical protein